jgi:hypothetical protein
MEETSDFVQSLILQSEAYRDEQLLVIQALRLAGQQTDKATQMLRRIEDTLNALRMRRAQLPVMGRRLTALAPHRC